MLYSEKGVNAPWTRQFPKLKLNLRASGWFPSSSTFIKSIRLDEIYTNISSELER